MAPLPKCRHCHCALFKADGELLAQLRNHEPSKKFHKELDKKKLLRQEEERVRAERKEEDKTEAIEDFKREARKFKNQYKEVSAN